MRDWKIGKGEGWDYDKEVGNSGKWAKESSTHWPEIDNAGGTI